MDEVLDDLRAFIANRLREGFESVHEIIENANDYATERHGKSDLRQLIGRMTSELLEAQRAEQSGWAESTDCDRLDQAFAALNSQDIVARQNFSCCNTCGFAEIWDEIEKEEAKRPVEGYVFYHLQCTEHAMKTGELLLAYGCVEENEVMLAQIANKVVTALRRVGLDAKWEGTADRPIVVEGIVWHRRR